MIGDDIVVTISGVTGNQVKVGITAPDNVPVHREEVYNKIKMVNEMGGEKNFNR